MTFCLVLGISIFSPDDLDIFLLRDQHHKSSHRDGDTDIHQGEMVTRVSMIAGHKNQVGKRLTKLLIAYSSIIFGFYFAFSLVFPDEPSMNHMLYRFVSSAVAQLEMLQHL